LKTVILGNEGIKTSRLGLGTGSLHHLYTSSGRQALLYRACDKGISYFDTAPLYGHGLAEYELGKFAKGRRDKVTIVTKFGIWPDSLYKRSIYFYYMRMALSRLPGGPRPGAPKRDFNHRKLTNSVENSLRRLRTDYLDVLVLHEPALHELNQPEELSRLLMSLKQAGKIRAFGLSAPVDIVLTINKVCPSLCGFLQIWWKPEQNLVSALATIERKPDASFGHFHAQKTANSLYTMGNAAGRSHLIKQAINTNQEGVVLFSTRNIDHLDETVEDFVRMDNLQSTINEPRQ